MHKILNLQLILFNANIQRKMMLLIVQLQIKQIINRRLLPLRRLGLKIRKLIHIIILWSLNKIQKLFKLSTISIIPQSKILPILGSKMQRLLISQLPMVIYIF